MIISLFFWAIFGALVGALAKFFMPGDDPSGWLKTIGIGIAGSYLGGIIKCFLFGIDDFSPSGLLFSVLGGVIFLFIWRKVEKYKILY